MFVQRTFRPGIAAGAKLVALVIACGVLGALYNASTANAHSPHPGVDFSIGVDTTGDSVPDCGTGVSQSTICFIAIGSTFTLRVYLNNLGGLSEYGAFDLYIQYAGVGSKNNPDADVWPDCGYELTYTGTPGLVAWGCSVDVPPAPDSTYTGLIGTSDFNCIANGTITMVHGGDNPGPPSEPQRTFLADPSATNHSEGQLTSEVLSIMCGDAPPVGGVALERAPWHLSGGPLGVSLAGWLSAALSLLIAGALVRRFRTKRNA